MPRTTIKDIARECGVSLSTVSLVLNRNPRISELTRQKVLEAVARRGYQPNTQARGLASKSSHTVSIVIPHLDHIFADAYFGKIVSGIYEYAAEQSYKMVLDVANLKFIRSHEYLNLLKSRRADGMLFIASSLYDQYLRGLEDQPYPFVLVNHYFPDINLNYVAADYVASARLAADHLLGLGHRAIGLINGTNIQTAYDFTDHFKRFCREGGVAEKDLVWADGRFSEEEGYRATQRLLAANPRITAIMAGNDKMAVGALRYLRSAGIGVPEQVSVMGMDDVPAASYTTPSITTIRHPLYNIGRIACERLLMLFREEIAECREVLPVELVVRESTGPAPV